MLVNLTDKDLSPPLSQFNATTPSKEDMLKLMKVVNAQLGEKALTKERVERAFEQWWGEFEARFGKIKTSYKIATPSTERTVPDMVTEILEIARSIQKSLYPAANPWASPWNEGYITSRISDLPFDAPATVNRSALANAMSEILREARMRKAAEAPEEKKENGGQQKKD